MSEVPIYPMTAYLAELARMNPSVLEVLRGQQATSQSAADRFRQMAWQDAVDTGARIMDTDNEEVLRANNAVSLGGLNNRVRPAFIASNPRITPDDYYRRMTELPEAEYRSMIHGDWPDDAPETPRQARQREARERAEWQRQQATRPITREPFPFLAHSNHTPADRTRITGYQSRIAQPEAENADLRAALGYSSDNSPALGGGK